MKFRETTLLVLRVFLLCGDIPNVFFRASRNSFFGGLLEDTEPLPPNLFDFSPESQVFGFWVVVSGPSRPSRIALKKTLRLYPWKRRF